MTLLTSTSDVGGILPDEYGALVIEPVQQGAVALNPAVATMLTTTSHRFCIPVLREEAAAAWLAEGDDLDPDDPTLDELIVVPGKVGGLTPISRELANDSTPAAQTIVGESLARAIAGQLDAAFFGALASPAPGGLASLPIYDDSPPVDGIVEVDAASFADLDPFAEAMSKIEADGGRVTSFVTDPVTALTLSKLKDETGSNRPLLGIDATAEVVRRVLGVPLFVSRYVDAGSAYALDAASIYVVVREGVEIAISTDAYFTSDRVAVRAIMRAGFGFPMYGRIVRIVDLP